MAASIHTLNPATIADKFRPHTHWRRAGGSVCFSSDGGLAFKKRFHHRKGFPDLPAKTKASAKLDSRGMQIQTISKEDSPRDSSHSRLRHDPSEMSDTSDREFTSRLCDEQADAVEEFCGRFREVLRKAFHQLRDLVPGCRQSACSVTPHVAYASASGYRKQADASSFQEYLCGLFISDLQLAAACLQMDNDSCQYVIHLVETRIAPTVRRRWSRGRLPESTISDVAEGLPGRLWTHSQTSTSPRLRQFDGNSTFATWLTGTADNMLRDEWRKHKRRGLSDNVTPEDAEPIADDSSGESDVETDDLQENFQQRFFHALKTVYRERLSGSERTAFGLVFGLRKPPSQAADIMGVSRARVSQLQSSIRDKVTDEVRSIAVDFAEATGLPADDVAQGLVQGLDAFLEKCSDEQGWSFPIAAAAETTVSSRAASS